MIATMVMAVTAQAFEEGPATATVGKAAPAFSLLDLDGKRRSLEEFKDKTVVLEWLSADCPASLFARSGMNELFAKYRDKNVTLLGIDSTHYQTDEALRQYKEKRQVEYAILIDRDGLVGRLYGAKTTPHLFIVHKGKLVYSGALDDGGFRRKGDRNYVAEALDAIFAGKEVAVSTTVPYGCSIKYAPKQKP
jgi:peroxiredoxin